MRTMTETVSKRSYGRLSYAQMEKFREILRRHASQSMIVGEANPATQASRWMSMTGTLPIPAMIKSKREVSYDELAEMIEKGTAQLIDIREPKELEEMGAIPTAINIPSKDLASALELTDIEFKDKYGFHKPGLYNNVVLYGHGAIKSTTALEIAVKRGLKSAKSYPGGFEDWIQRNGKDSKIPESDEFVP